MNKVKYYIFFFCLFFVTYNSCHTDLPAIIFTLHPLTTKTHDTLSIEQIISHIKYATIPLTTYFLYSVTQNHIGSDIVNNPYTSAIIAYLTYHCGYYIVENYKNRIIKLEMENIMQNIFYFIVIGHGMYNSILQTMTLPATSISDSDKQLKQLELFLQKSHDTWMILYLEYTKKHDDQMLINYKSNQINTLDVLQAMTHDTDIMNSFMHDYQKNNYTYNIKTILELLENKLILYHQKFIKLQLS